MPNVEHHHGAYLITGRGWGGERGTLVQTDWEYPYAAQRLGWNMRRVQPGKDGPRILKHAPPRGKGCDHRSDGTVTCKCGLTAGDFISAAAEYLDSLC